MLVTSLCKYARTPGDDLPYKAHFKRHYNCGPNGLTSQSSEINKSGMHLTKGTGHEYILRGDVQHDTLTARDKIPEHH